MLREHVEKKVRMHSSLGEAGQVESLQRAHELARSTLEAVLASPVAETSATGGPRDGVAASGAAEGPEGPSDAAAESSGAAAGETELRASPGNSGGP